MGLDGFGESEVNQFFFADGSGRLNSWFKSPLSPSLPDEVNGFLSSLFEVLAC